MIGFLCPDINIPSGGTKRLYRHVDVLNKRWPDIASIVHTQEGFRLKWFENDTNIVDKQTFKEQLRKDDIVVIPTYCPPEVLDEWEGVKKVYYNLGCYHTFEGHPCPTPKTIFQDIDLLAIVVVSQEDYDFIKAIDPDLSVHLVKSGINTTIFYPEIKEKVIATNRRKMQYDINSVLNFAIQLNRDAFKGWIIQYLEGYSFEAYAEALRKASIYLYLNPPQQGFPGPVLEAVACGCQVLSYEGTGRNILDQLGIGLVTQGDIRLMANWLVGEVLDETPSTVPVWGPKYVAKNYSLIDEEKSIIEVWENINL